LSGSSDAAQRAGSQVAAAVTIVSDTIATIKLAGSTGSTP